MSDTIPWARIPVDRMWDTKVMEVCPGTYVWDIDREALEQAHEIHRKLVMGETVDSSLVESVLAASSFQSQLNMVSSP